MRISCGPEAAPVGSAYVTLDPDPEGGAGLQIVGGNGPDHFVVSFNEEKVEAAKGEVKEAEAEPTGGVFTIAAQAPLAAGEGCTVTEGEPNQVTCPTLGPARWMMADLGPGNDSRHVCGPRSLRGGRPVLDVRRIKRWTIPRRIPHGSGRPNPDHQRRKMSRKERKQYEEGKS